MSFGPNPNTSPLIGASDDPESQEPQQQQSLERPEQRYNPEDAPHNDAPAQYQPHNTSYQAQPLAQGYNEYPTFAPNDPNMGLDYSYQAQHQQQIPFIPPTQNQSTWLGQASGEWWNEHAAPAPNDPSLGFDYSNQAQHQQQIPSIPPTQNQSNSMGQAMAPWRDEFAASPAPAQNQANNSGYEARHQPSIASTAPAQNQAHNHWAPAQRQTHSASPKRTKRKPESSPYPPAGSAKTNRALSPRAMLRSNFEPPGQSEPGYVKFGVKGVATKSQGNYADIHPSTRDLIVDEEVDNQQKRPKSKRLSCAEVLNKYPAWGVSVSTLQNRNTRKFNPKAERLLFRVEHLEALRQAVSRTTEHNRQWSEVAVEVERLTNKLFFVSDIMAKWREVEAKKLDEPGSGDLSGLADIKDEDQPGEQDYNSTAERPGKRSRSHEGKEEDEDEDEDEDEEDPRGRRRRKRTGTR